MEILLRASEALRLAFPYISIGVVALMACILLVRFLKGSRVHRVCLAWASLPMGVFGAYAVIAATTSWYTGHPAHAALFAVIAVVHCVGSFLFFRLARSL